MTKTKNNLREIQDLLEGAIGDEPDEKWVLDEEAGEVRHSNGLVMCERPSINEGQWEFVGRFIAKAPEIVRSLMAEVVELREAKAAAGGKKLSWCCFCGERTDHDESNCPN